MSDDKQDCSVVDYYKLLQISPSATQVDIINAYRHAKLAYQQDSLAVYSLFSEQELELIREQVEQAYHVLSDLERRHQYDEANSFSDELSDVKVSADNVIPLHKPVAGSPKAAQESTSALISSDFCGEFLRQAREARGVSLESIAGQTKISKHYLQAIEDEDIAHFPELVYLKGYLRQYCHEIGLDPEPVVAQYISLMALKKGFE